MFCVFKSRRSNRYIVYNSREFILVSEQERTLAQQSQLLEMATELIHEMTNKLEAQQTKTVQQDKEILRLKYLIGIVLLSNLSDLISVHFDRKKRRWMDVKILKPK